MFTAEEFNSYIWHQEEYFLESFLAWTALGPRLNCAPDMPSHVNIDEVYHALIASFP